MTPKNIRIPTYATRSIIYIYATRSIIYAFCLYVIVISSVSIVKNFFYNRKVLHKLVEHSRHDVITRITKINGIHNQNANIPP